jgi:mitogen-activated protein kinase 15
MEITGRPSQEDIEAIQSSLATTMLESLPPSKPKSLNEIFPTASEDAVDLLDRLLQFNPEKRLSAEEALEHPYVSQFHNEDDEPVCRKIINITMDDNHKFSIREYREKLYSDIHKRKKELRKKILQSHHSYFSKYK